jgi:hypothetical protein
MDLFERQTWPVALVVDIPSFAVLQAVPTGHDGRDIYRDTEHQSRGVNEPGPGSISWRSILAQLQTHCYGNDQETMCCWKVSFKAHPLVS